MKGYSSTSRNRARRMRNSFTDAELRLWQLLRNRNLKAFKFRRQHPLGPYIADFICLDQRLVIEVDGGQHQQQTRYDSKRTDDLEAAGYRVLRFWDNDVLLHTDDVMQAIYNALHVAPHPAPAEGGAGSKRIVLGWRVVGRKRGPSGDLTPETRIGPDATRSWPVPRSHPRKRGPCSSFHRPPGAGCSAATARVLLCAYTVASPKSGPMLHVSAHLSPFTRGEGTIKSA
jgi:very-short-patch-repair endonuclease